MIGVPDSVLGEVGVAFLVPAEPALPPDRDEVRAWCRERIADYKVPDRIGIVDALPLTPMHKTDKRALTALASEAVPTRKNGRA